MAVPSDNSTGKNSENLSNHTGGGVVIDLGTGDGRFVYRSALKNPDRFYIGIDANAKALEKISMKATRNKGGASNVLFLQAAVEDLPAELEGAADEIHIHFPWGSLLQAVAAGRFEVLQSLRRICSENCLVEIIFGVDQTRDRAEIERLNLPELSNEYLEKTLIPKYEAAGFQLLEKETLLPADHQQLETSWAKKLLGGEHRRILCLIFRAS